MVVLVVTLLFKLGRNLPWNSVKHCSQAEVRFFFSLKTQFQFYFCLHSNKAKFSKLLKPHFKKCGVLNSLVVLGWRCE